MIDLTDPKKNQEILDSIREISLEMSKIDDAREQIKEIIDTSSAAFELEKKTLRKVAKLFHSRTVALFEAEVGEVKELYSAITKPQP